MRRQADVRRARRWPWLAAGLVGLGLHAATIGHAQPRLDAGAREACLRTERLMADIRQRSIPREEARREFLRILDLAAMSRTTRVAQQAAVMRSAASMDSDAMFEATLAQFQAVCR